MLIPLFIFAITADIIFLTESSDSDSATSFTNTDYSSNNSYASRNSSSSHYTHDHQDETNHKCGSDERFVECPDAVCVPKTCDEVGYPVPCIDIGPGGKCPSKPACICKEGYVKNSQGICIPMKKCPSCGGDNNAVSGCGVNCDKHCSDYFGNPRPCLKICYTNACDCKEGYYYEESVKKCVHPSKCEPECPENENYEKCPAQSCTPQTCSQLGYPINCTDVTKDSPCPTKPGCVCNNGYVRNHRGICIPTRDCPSCGGDKNAESGCGFECGNHCMDLYNDKPRPCILICRVNGCQCKQGKYYDEITKKCVNPSNCTEVCRKNEVFSECINGGCDKRNCSQLNKPKVCIDPKTCKKGCVCRDGYLRHPNGNCVLEKKCPPPCGENEVYNGCLEGVCKATTCKQLGYPFACAAVVPTTCTEGCLCKDDYLRADNGTCIPAKCCPSCGGDTNAVAGCGNYCNTRCSDIGKKPNPCKDVCNTNTCDCKKGFYLDEESGKCVPPEKCSDSSSSALPSES